MYFWRYNILLEVKERYLTILSDIGNVSVFVCIAFKNAGDLQAKNQHNICQCIEKRLENCSISERPAMPRKINEVQ